MNKLGVHALVWVGGWSEAECAKAIRSTAELGYDYRLAGGGSHLDLSPQGKRAALAKAHLAARAESGSFFG